MDIKNNNATGRMQDIFTNYHTLFVRNGLKCILDKNKKVAVKHVLSAIQPSFLKDCVTADLSIPKREL